MNYVKNNYIHSDLTGKIIGAGMKVHSYYGGSGFLESVYENALRIELESMGLKVRQQFRIPVYYKGQVSGDFVADLIVNDLVIIELKAVKELHSRHEVQLMNYLRATSIEVGLLLNFGEERRLRNSRKVFLNANKKGLIHSQFTD